jgi:hypothetical protein
MVESTRWARMPLRGHCAPPRYRVPPHHAKRCPTPLLCLEGGQLTRRPRLRELGSEFLWANAVVASRFGATEVPIVQGVAVSGQRGGRVPATDPTFYVGRAVESHRGPGHCAGFHQPVQESSISSS